MCASGPEKRRFDFPTRPNVGRRRRRRNAFRPVAGLASATSSVFWPVRRRRRRFRVRPRSSGGKLKNQRTSVLLSSHTHTIGQRILLLLCNVRTTVIKTFPPRSRAVLYSVTSSRWKRVKPPDDRDRWNSNDCIIITYIITIRSRGRICLSRRTSGNVLGRSVLSSLAGEAV